MKQEIEIEDLAISEDQRIIRFGWPRRGELFLYDGKTVVADFDYRKGREHPVVILCRVWTAPDWVLADWIKRSGSEVYFKMDGDADWYRMFNIKPESLNLPADWYGSPMRCRREVSSE